MIETKEEEKIIENYIIKKNKEEIKRIDKKREKRKDLNECTKNIWIG